MDLTDAEQALLNDFFGLARDHDFYREHLRGVRSWRDAPPADKQLLAPALARFSPGDEPRGVYLVRSGGSTQVPLIFPVDIAENLVQRRRLAERLRAAGMFGPGSVALNLFGYSDLYRSAAILDDLIERCEATTLPMSAHSRYEDMLAVARRFAPTHLIGTPSKLTLFARFLIEAGETLAIPQLLYAGEPLRGSTAALLADTFGVRQLWSLYGGAETGIFGWSDATREPGLFRLLPGVIVEVPEPDGEGFGSLVVTNCFRERFPVFRYRVGDTGRLVERDGERLLELRGRDARSFQFAEMHFDLAPFAALVASAEAFQIQLRFDAEGRDALELLLVDEVGACGDVSAGLATLLASAGPRSSHKLRRVFRDALHHDPTTTKTPPLVDLRR